MFRLAPLFFLAALGCPPADAPSSETGRASTSGTSKDGRTISLDLGETLAVIDGIPVGSNEFAQVAARRAPGGGAALTAEERLTLLDELVDQKALYLEAKAQGIDQDPKVQRQMIQILLRRTVYSQVKGNDFTDEELRSYYEAHREEFIIPEKVRARRIYIKADPVRSKEEAERIAAETLGKINGDIDAIAKLAIEVSEDPFRQRGGDLGLISRKGLAGLPQEVIDKAFSLQAGQISEVFWAEDGFNIVGTVLKRDKVERTFEQMKGAVLRRAKSERQKELYDSTVAKLREGTDVTINEEAVKSLDLTANGRRPADVRPMGKSSGGPRIRPTAPAPRPPGGDALPGGMGEGE